MSEEIREEEKYRNLTRDETERFIAAFVELLKVLEINNKKFLIAGDTKNVYTNPELSIEEIRKVTGVRDKTKADFILQLYSRQGHKILKKLFPNEKILNLPVFSVEGENEAIVFHY